MKLTCCVSLMICLTIACHVQAESGPAAGSDVPELKVAAVAGLVSGEEKDFVAERKDQPTFYVFVQADKFDRPVARFLKVLDQTLAKDHREAQIIAVWLTADQEKSKTYLPIAQQSIKLEQTIWTVFPGEKTGPAKWDIDIASTVTVVVANGAKVLKSFEYGSINDTVVPEILKSLK